MRGGGLAGDSWVGGHNDFLYFFTGEPFEEALNREFFRSDALEGGNGAVQHMVEAFVDSSVFQYEDIAAFFHDAELPLIPTDTFTDHAQPPRTEMAAALTHRNSAPKFKQGLGKFLELGGGLLEQVQGQAFRRLGADARQFSKTVDQAPQLLWYNHHTSKSFHEMSPMFKPEKQRG